MPRPDLPYVFAYLFEGEDGVTLFDSGFGTPEATAALTEGLAARAHRPSDIQRLIISHSHPDHYGMAAWVKEQSPGCELVMLDREWSWIEAREASGEGWMARSDGWLMRHGMSRSEIDEGHRAEEARRSGGMAPSPSREARHAARGRRRALLRRLGARGGLDARAHARPPLHVRAPPSADAHRRSRAAAHLAQRLAALRPGGDEPARRLPSLARARRELRQRARAAGARVHDRRPPEALPRAPPPPRRPPRRGRPGPPWSSLRPAPPRATWPRACSGTPGASPISR